LDGWTDINQSEIQALIQATQNELYK